MNKISPVAVAAALAIFLAAPGMAQIIGVPGASPTTSPRNISGTVTDPSGAPAADVEVTILPTLGATRSFRTDAQGRYSLDWQPIQLNVARGQPAQTGLAASGITYSIMARDQGRDLVAVSRIDISTSSQDLHLQTGLTISGSITVPDGIPVSTGTVQLTPITGSIGVPFNRQPIRVDARGAFDIPALPRGLQYTVNVRADGFGAASSPISASDSDTETLKLPVFVLRPATLSLAGRVLDGNDKPIPGAQVRCSGEGQPNSNTTADASGHFELKVCDGPVQVIAFSPNGLNRAVAVVQTRGGDNGVVIRITTNPVANVVNGVRQILKAGPLVIRGEPKPPLMTWDYFKMWPAMHKTTIYSLAAVQLLVLLTVGAGIFWVVWRGRA